MDDITNLPALTPDQAEKAGRLINRELHRQDTHTPVRRSPRLNTPSPTKGAAVLAASAVSTPPSFAARSPHSASFKAKVKASPSLKRVITPLKKQASKTALLAFQMLASPSSRRVAEVQQRAPKLIGPMMSSASSSSLLLTPKKAQTAVLWRDSAPHDLLDILSKDELKRQELIFELVNTEEKYIEDLKLVVNSFLLPLYQVASVKQDDVDVVFAGIEDLIAINEALYRDLRDRQQESIVVEQIGDIVLKRADSFLGYADYIGERARGDHQLAVLSKNPHVAALLRENLQKEECRRLDFSNFLDQPRRRLAKYACLFNEIDKCTPDDHPDKQQFSAAWAKLHDVLIAVDTQSGEMMNEFRLDHLRDLLITKDDKQKQSLSLLNEASVMLYQDKLRHVKDAKELDAFLLNNCLVLAKEATKGEVGQLKLFKQVFARDSIIVSDSSSDPSLTDPTCFKLSLRGSQEPPVILAASSPYLKDTWMQHLEEVIE